MWEWRFFSSSSEGAYRPFVRGQTPEIPTPRPPCRLDNMAGCYGVGLSCYKGEDSGADVSRLGRENNLHDVGACQPGTVGRNHSRGNRGGEGSKFARRCMKRTKKNCAGPRTM